MSINFGLRKETTLQATSNQVSSEVGEELIILQLQAGQYYGLSGVGAQIWKLLQSPITMAQIEESVLEEFDVSVEVFRNDFEMLLDELMKANLIEIRPD